MRISNEVTIDRLIPGNKYVIAINWNDTNTLRTDGEYLLHGIFKRIEFIRGRTYSYDTGLSILLSPSRINAIFDVNGQTCKISSANRFFERYPVDEHEICSEYTIRYLHLPTDMKRVIRKYF